MISASSRLLLTLAAALYLSPAAAPCAAKEIGGVKLPDSYPVGEQSLKLNGAGLRTKMVFKVYAAGLYTAKPSANATTLIQADAPAVIRMHFIHSKVSSKKLIAAWDDGFKNSCKGKTQPLSREMARFNACFSEAARKGDIIDLVYLPGVGTEIWMGKKKVETIEGLAFKQALWGIWLCDKPADSKLKKGLLGK